MKNKLYEDLIDSLAIKIACKRKKEKLLNYYNDKELTIIGLNDSQGFNATSIFGNGLLDCIERTLSKVEDKTIINAFSKLLNKTEHIDYLLESNLSVDDIKKIQLYNTIENMEKTFNKLTMKQILDICKILYKTNEEDENIHITDVIKNSKEPNIIYSSGINDLIRLIGSDKNQIIKDYKQKEEKPNYNYVLEKTKDFKVIEKVINNIERNFNHILSLNENADIYALGCYVPKTTQLEEMDLFRNIIVVYNERLKKLCKEYNITFINVEKIGKKYSKKDTISHINSKGHNAIANAILNQMYINKILNKKEKIKREYIYEAQKLLSENPVLNLEQRIAMDYMTSLTNGVILSGYEAKRADEIAEEQKKEINILKKVRK